MGRKARLSQCFEPYLQGGINVTVLKGVRSGVSLKISVLPAGGHGLDQAGRPGHFKPRSKKADKKEFSILK